MNSVRGAKPQLIAESQRVNLGWHGRRRKEMRNFCDPRIGRMPADNRRRGGIVHHDGRRGGREALQHGPFEIARVGGGARAVLPQVLGQRASPFSVIENELVDVLLFGEPPEEEMFEHRVVQNHNARMGQRSIVNRAVQLVVADVIHRDIGAAVVYPHLAVLAKRVQQGFGVIRDSGFGGRKRREVAYGHGLTRGPNRAVPTRTCVEPSSMAASRSCDMPIDSFVSPCRRASDASSRK